MNYKLNEEKMFADISDNIAIIINTQTGIYYGLNCLATLVFENGIANGITSTNFEPDTVVDRGQAVTFIWRAEGQPDIEMENPFEDIKSDEYYSKAVLWAFKNGITSGVTETMFKPGEPCTRGQIVTLLYRNNR